MGELHPVPDNESMHECQNIERGRKTLYLQLHADARFFGLKSGSKKEPNTRLPVPWKLPNEALLATHEAAATVTYTSIFSRLSLLNVFKLIALFFPALSVIFRISRIGKRIAYQIKGKRNNRNDKCRKNQQVGSVDKISSGVSQQNP